VKIEQIFPIPVMFDNFSRSLTTEEIEFAKNVALQGNILNHSSLETYVLKLDMFQELSSWIETRYQDYFQNIWQPRGNVELYTTQSWINHTNPGEEHHVHSHPNSIVSGVFYFDADPAVDKITFVKTNTKEIDLLPTQFNIFNSNIWYYPVETGKLVLFPSTLKHTVDRVQESSIRKTRISLSFNTFIKGIINPGPGLSELIL
jgi:uncharacterized protein (TIGR02466 family)